MRLHLRDNTVDGVMPQGVCNVLSAHVTDDPAAVDCALCKRHMVGRINAGESIAPDPLAIAIEDVFNPRPTDEYSGDWARNLGAALRQQRHPPLVLSPGGDPMVAAREGTGQYSKDPAEREAAIAEKREAHEMWRRHVDGCTCGTCEYCLHGQRLRQKMAREPYQKRHGVRDEHAPRWSSARAALEAYVGHRADGYPCKSWGGTYDTICTLGSFVQNEGGERGFSAAQRAAHDVAAVESALDAAFDGEFDDRYLSDAECVAVLLARAVGRLQLDSDAGRKVQRYVPAHEADVAEALGGISRTVVREVVKHGFTTVHEYLCDRGLVPVRRRAG